METTPIILTAREASAIRKQLYALFLKTNDIRVREPVRKTLLALSRAERSTGRRITKINKINNHESSN